MTTPLTKSVKRYAPREGLVVTMTPEGITIREPRRRFTYGPVTYGMIKLIAAKQLAEEARKEKAAAKALRKAERRLARSRR